VPSVLEQPAPRAWCNLGDRIAVRGWLAGPSTRLRGLQVTARCGGGTPQVLAAGLARPDLAMPDAVGFEGLVSTSGLPAGPHVLTVTAAAEDGVLREWQRTVCIESTDAQYGRWLQACAARGAPEAVGDRQVTWLVRGPEGPALQRTLQSLRDAGAPGGPVGDHVAGHLPVRTTWLGVLQAGDLLHADALNTLDQVLARRPTIDAVYADHDHLDAEGARVDPVFKPGWSPLEVDDPLRWQRGWVLRHALLGDSVAALVAGDAQGQALLQQRLLRNGMQVHHLPWPLTSEAQPRALRADARARVTEPHRSPELAWPSVSVIVPSRLSDRAMLGRCLDSLQTESGVANIDVTVVLNNLQGLDSDTAISWLRPWGVQVLQGHGAFNWSALNNQGALATRGDWLLFLNDDVEALQPGWLTALLAAAGRQDVGCAGAVLRYPDGTLQHAGVWLDGRNAWAGRHHFRHASGREPRVARWLQQDREQTAVTGACLLTPRRLFDAVGGFDEGLPVVFNDVDYCLRLRQLGWRSVVAAGAELTHHESVSRGGIPEQADHLRFQARWSQLLPMVDPFWHPCLSADRDDWHPCTDNLPPLDARP
jgi:Glycosyltransferase like family 2